MEPLLARAEGHIPPFPGIEEAAGGMPTGIFGATAESGVGGTLSSVFGTLLIECRRECGVDPVTLPVVPRFGNAMPGKPSSFVPPLAPGVKFGSTETTDRMGKTRSVAYDPRKGDWVGLEEGELLVRFREEESRLAREYRSRLLVCHRVDAVG